MLVLSVRATTCALLLGAVPSALAGAAAAPVQVQAPVQAPGQGRAEPFGRWQPQVLECQRNLAGSAAASCAGVLVDQRSSGVFRVSWPGGGASPGLASVLTFVGTLSGTGEPMVCRQAICSFAKPMEISLSTVSQTVFDGRGVASGLPSAWPANGSCRLEQSRIRCEARALSGEIWTALARLR